METAIDLLANSLKTIANVCELDDNDADISFSEENDDSIDNEDIGELEKSDNQNEEYRIEMLNMEPEVDLLDTETKVSPT